MKDAAIIIGIVLLAFGLIFSIIELAEYSDRKRCEGLGRTISYQTKYEAGFCFVELRPGLWIKENEVLHILPLLGVPGGNE